jgi:hypothetical protein
MLQGVCQALLWAQPFFYRLKLSRLSGKGLCFVFIPSLFREILYVRWEVADVDFLVIAE